MASTVWKGYISFGLISIPVRLFTAARDDRISFNQVHRECNTRIKQQLFCPTCERVVERSEIAKGYAQTKDRFILIEDEELKAIAPASSETMELQQFVEMQDIDPIYFDASYYVVPEEPGRKAYQLLLTAMKNQSFAALAQVAMHQREYTVVLRPYHKGLMLHTMYYANEVREITEFKDQPEIEVRKQELELAERLITALAQPFNPEAFKDQYQEKVRELIEAKGEGKALQGEARREPAPVVDLMKALESSLAGLKPKPPEKAEKPRTKTAQRKAS